MQQHKFSEAASLYSDLLKQHPEVDEAILQLARCDAELGNTHEAESLLRRYVAQNSVSAPAHALLGRMLLRSGKSSEAVAEFHHALLLDPLLMEARLGLAACAILGEDYSNAIRILRAAQKINSNDNDVSLMEAEALYKNHQRKAAILQIHHVLHNDPNNSAAIAMLGSIRKAAAR